QRRQQIPPTPLLFAVVDDRSARRYAAGQRLVGTSEMKFVACRVIRDQFLRNNGQAPYSWPINVMYPQPSQMQRAMRYAATLTVREQCGVSRRQMPRSTVAGKYRIKLGLSIVALMLM